MSKKRRTRKDKINPNRNISISWEPSKTEAKNDNFEANVKGQLKNAKNTKASKRVSKNSTMLSGKNEELASIKRNLVKSLIFSTLIIASEVVIYLIWY